jgi:hypothetical protein
MAGRGERVENGPVPGRSPNEKIRVCRNYNRQESVQVILDRIINVTCLFNRKASPHISSLHLIPFFYRRLRTSATAVVPAFPAAV